MKVSTELSELREEVESISQIKNSIHDLEEMFEILSEEELVSELERIEKELKEKEVELFFNNKYDKGSAMVTINSGAGGIEAEDWAAMLFRMYQRYCEEKNFKTEVLDKSVGEDKGIKSVTFSVKGKYAYGLLRRESGVHRLVRISPYSSQNLRHTSFASVEVLPEVEASEVEINSDDIRVDYYRASGPGGQIGRASCRERV